MARQISGNENTTPLSPHSGVEPSADNTGSMNGAPVRPVFAQTQVSPPPSDTPVPCPVGDAPIEQRAAKPKAAKKPNAKLDLKDYYKRVFSDGEDGARELVSCLHRRFEKLGQKRMPSGLIDINCKQLKYIVSIRGGSERLESLKLMEASLLQHLSSMNDTQMEQGGKEMVACLWWCRMLQGELTALEAMHLLPEAVLCRHCDAIVQCPLFTDSKNIFLQCRANLIRRHAAEHGNTSALKWLIYHCLINEKGACNGFSIEEGFHWLHTYRQLLAQKTVSEIPASGVIGRLVEQGRDFLSPDNVKAATDRERLIAVGLRLDPRFGKVDREEAQALLTPLFKRDPEQPSVSSNDMAVAWLWRGVLAMPEAYEKWPCNPKAQQCFRKSAQLGCSDGDIKCLQIVAQQARCEQSQRGELRRMIEDFMKKPCETVAPEVWAVCFEFSWLFLFSSSAGKLPGKGKRPSKGAAKSGSRVTNIAVEQWLSQRLFSAACHGQPEARSMQLLRNFVPVYCLELEKSYPSLRDSLSDFEGSKDSESFKQCCSLLKCCSHIETDSQLLVYRVVGNEQLRVFGTTEPEDEMDALLDKAVQLNPLAACGAMNALRIVTKKYSIRYQADLIKDHFEHMSPHQRLHAATVFRKKHSLKETLNSSGYRTTSSAYRYLETPMNVWAAQLYSRLVECEEKEKARKFWNAASSKERSEHWLAAQDVREGRYVCHHKERVKAYNLKAVQGVDIETNEIGAHHALDSYFEWEMTLPEKCICPLQAWQAIYVLMTIFRTHSAFYSLDTIEKIVNFLPGLMNRYERSVDKAEHTFGLMIKELLPLCTKEVGSTEQIKALISGDAPREGEQGTERQCDQLILPLSYGTVETQADFYNMDKSDPNNIIAKFQSLPDEPDQLTQKQLSRCDLPELLFYLVPALQNSQMPDETISALAEKAVAYIEWVITDSRNITDSDINVFFSTLQAQGDHRPKCNWFKNRLKKELTESLVTRKERKWIDQSYCGNNKDYNHFVTTVDLVLDSFQLAVDVTYKLSSDPVGVIGKLELVWSLDAERKEKVIAGIEKMNTDTGRISEVESRVAIKLINKVFDDEVWRVLTKQKVSEVGNKYPIVLMLISKQIAYSDRLSDQEISSLFSSMEKLEKNNEQKRFSNIYFYKSLWLEQKDDNQASQLALLEGKKIGSPLCLLELAQKQRKDGFLDRAKTLYNTLESPSDAHAYGCSQFEAGETMLQQQSRAGGVGDHEAIFSHWWTASHYQHPVALCRLFSCLCPEPDEKYCKGNEWTAIPFLAEALEAPSAKFSAGKEVCRQLFRRHNNMSFDMVKLKAACVALDGAELLVLSQLPDSIWPPSNESPTLQEQLRGKAIACINQHRQQPGDDGGNIIEGVYLPALSYYEEESRHFVPLPSPTSAKPVSIKDKVKDALTSALNSKNEALFFDVFQKLYTTYQDKLLNFVDDSDLQLQVMDRLFSGGHVEIAMKFLRSETSSTRSQTLLQQLSYAANIKNKNMMDCVIDELAELEDWDIRSINEDTVRSILAAFLSGKLNGTDSCTAFDVLQKLMEFFPEQWKSQLESQEDISHFEFLDYFHGDQSKWLESFQLKPQVKQSLIDSMSPG